MKRKSLTHTLVEQFSDMGKSSLPDLVESFEYLLNHGSIDDIHLLKALTMMKKLGTSLTSTAKDNPFSEKAKAFMDGVYDSVSKLKTDNVLLGAKFETSETGVKYDYTNCGDKIWDALVAQKETLEETIKEREKFLKTIPYEGLPTFDEKSGETSTLFPPSKVSTSTVKVTLK